MDHHSDTSPVTPGTLLTLPAPAKLNLFLHVVGRRPDGYHLLQTVFQLLDYGDTLSFGLREDGNIALTPELPGVPTTANLVYRAARALQRATGSTLGATIHLHKRLPSGAGLGGGSSDAATTLLALNRLWSLDLSLTELADIGLALGADVPVFVHGRSAWAEGIGEQLSPVDLPERWFLVVYPGCTVNTGKIFCHEELTRDDQAITMCAFLGGGGNNSCQPVVEKLYPVVRHARQWLEQFAPTQMTGTGSCLFASFPSEAAAQTVLDQLPGVWKGFIAKGVNYSATHTALIECF